VKLVLFDIDGTILWSDGAGRRAMQRALMTAFGTSGNADYRYDGKTDMQIVRDLMRMDVDNSRKVFGRDIHHVLLLHLGSFSSHILPDLFKLLDEEGFEIVTLEEAQKDPAYDYDPDIADPRGGTLVELGMKAKQIPWPANAPVLPAERLTTICQ
jgi:phosphoglycolate phosphatase-like HAD superfamily hydrolase